MYGNWSRRDQMKGSQPSPTIGLHKVLSTRFRVVEVDEYRTSKVCNLCKRDLSSYIKKDRKKSYSRLCCTNCICPKDRSKRFVNRDLNAAANILLAGTSHDRPISLRRNRKRPLTYVISKDSPKQRCHTVNKPTVDAVGQSSSGSFVLFLP